MSLVEPGDGTVVDRKARKFVELVRAGAPLEQVEEATGLTLAQLRAQGGMSRSVRQLLARLGDIDLLVEENQKRLARARLTEITMQDEDLKVAIQAAKALLGTDATNVNVINQVQAGAPTDPAILSALMSLGLVQQEPKPEGEPTE